MTHIEDGFIWVCMSKKWKDNLKTTNVSISESFDCKPLNRNNSLKCTWILLNFSDITVKSWPSSASIFCWKLSFDLFADEKTQRWEMTGSACGEKHIHTIQKILL